MPFEDVVARDLHFLKHRNEFSFATAEEYEAAADAFMSANAKPPIRECFRPNEDCVRFDRRDTRLPIRAKSGWIKSFHRPSDKYIFGAYFKWECGRTDVS